MAVPKGQFSEKLLAHGEAKNAAALERIAIAKNRILSVLDRETVAHQKTLEQKIADQGPTPQRVDPHLLGLAIMDMLELNRLKRIDHPISSTKNWYANIGTADTEIRGKLDTLGPLYASVSTGSFSNLVGDALEVVTFKCIHSMYEKSKRYAYHGHFHLDNPKQDDRFQKTEPPQSLGGGSTKKRPDFIQYGYDEGPLCIECKNYREWLYPREQFIKNLIIKSHEMDALPVLIDRRIHYTTKANFFEPSGIMSHESYYQYYPSDKAQLADAVRHKRSLGFTDVRATETPDPRTVKFFEVNVPKIIHEMSKRWQKHRETLYDYAMDRLNLAQLYTIIGSPAGGKWSDPEPPDDPDGE